MAGWIGMGVRASCPAHVTRRLRGASRRKAPCGAFASRARCATLRTHARRTIHRRACSPTSPTSSSAAAAQRAARHAGALRWLAVIGQTIAVLVVHYGLEFELPLAACLSVIALSAWLNVALRMHFRNGSGSRRGRPRWLLAFDIAQLTVLLFLTGGLREPVRVPDSRAGADLRDRAAAALHAAARRVRGRLRDRCSCSVHWPLPWTSDEPLVLPPLYIARRSGSRSCVAIGFIGAYAWQIAEEGRQLADALTATELVLAREQHLSQLDGLAAAAAHELGTPLSTIAVVAKELRARARTGLAACRRREAAARAGAALPRHPRQAHRAAGRRHAVRAREALRADRGGGRAASQFRHRDRRRAAAASAPASRWPRARPAILYGLGNLVENAVDFAERARRGRGALERAGRRRHDRGRRAGLPAGDHRPHRRALCDQPRAAPAPKARRAGSASASSSPRRCWSAPARRSPSLNRPAPDNGAVVARALAARPISRRRGRSCSRPLRVGTPPPNYA